MFSKLGRNLKNLRWAVPLVALSFMACELDVADPSVVTEDELSGPSSVPTTVNGVVGDFASASEHYSLYSSMFTDEMILAGTFPTRVQVDERRVVPSNATVTGEVEETLQVARNQSQKMIELFNGFLGDEDFNQTALLEGIAIGHYVDALSTLQLGEIYCQVPLEGGATPSPSSDVVSAALTGFEGAEAAAGDAGLGDWQSAAILGQARAHLFLGEFGAAATDAGRVPSSHRLFVEYSTNDPDQFNKVFDLTWGSQNQVIRWTVGDGTQGERLNELFSPYALFADSLGIIDEGTGLSAFNSSITVQAQELYDEADDDILVSTGIYARLIEAESLIRSGDGGCDQGLLTDCSGTAEQILDVVRLGADEVSNWSGDSIPSWQQRWTNERFRVDVGLGPIDGEAQSRYEADFEDITPNQQLLILADEIARETWLTGTRQETARRFVEEFGAGTEMDIYPEKPGDQICWPVSEQEDTGASP